MKYDENIKVEAINFFQKYQQITDLALEEKNKMLQNEIELMELAKINAIQI